jgi:hypothetical protein
MGKLIVCIVTLLGTHAAQHDGHRLQVATKHRECTTPEQYQLLLHVCYRAGCSAGDVASHGCIDANAWLHIVCIPTPMYTAY